MMREIVRTHRRTIAQRGFTLIEVIVAIVVAALALSAIAGVFSGGLRTASSIDDMSRLVVAAESVLASAGLEKPLSDGTESGRDELRGVNWSLQIDPEPTTDPDSPLRPPLELKRLTVRVTVDGTVGGGSSRRAFELTTLRAVPRREL